MLSLLLICSSSILIQPFQEKSFLNWMRTNNKFYTGDEYHFRLGIYISNSRYVEQHNKAHRNFKISLNKFSTYTPAEYRTLLGEQTSINKNNPQIYQKKSKKDWPTPPEQLDWRVSGAVNEVVDQDACGGCWAFSAVSGAEGCWFLNKGELLKFSEQNLIDCVRTCHGCNGGYRDEAYKWVIEKQDGQFTPESDDPFTGLDTGACHFSKHPHVGGIKGYVQSTPEDEEELLSFVAHYGPTSVGIDASGSAFSAYASGIYDSKDECGSTYINHGVCCIGYGSENGLNYWIIRNSWGKNWGEEGYIRMIRGINICGVSSRVYSVYYDNE